MYGLEKCLNEKSRKFQQEITELSQDEESDSDDERIVIPHPNYSGSDGDFSSDDENAESGSSFPNESYRSIFYGYTEAKENWNQIILFLGILEKKIILQI